MENSEVKECVYRYCDSDGNLDDSLNYYMPGIEHAEYNKPCIEKLNDKFFKVKSKIKGECFTFDKNFNCLFEKYHYHDIFYVVETKTENYDYYLCYTFSYGTHLLNEYGESIIPFRCDSIDIEPLNYYKNIVIVGGNRGSFLYDIEKKEKKSGSYTKITSENIAFLNNKGERDEKCYFGVCMGYDNYGTEYWNLIDENGKLLWNPYIMSQDGVIVKYENKKFENIYGEDGDLIEVTSIDDAHSKIMELKKKNN